MKASSKNGNSKALNGDGIIRSLPRGPNPSFSTSTAIRSQKMNANPCSTPFRPLNPNDGLGVSSSSDEASPPPLKRPLLKPRKDHRDFQTVASQPFACWPNCPLSAIEPSEEWTWGEPLRLQMKRRHMFHTVSGSGETLQLLNKAKSILRSTNHCRCIEERTVIDTASKQSINLCSTPADRTREIPSNILFPVF